VPFVEESPSRAEPGSFTPRAFEQSLDAGEILAEIGGDAMRTETVRLRFGAGDPSLGAPRVVVQVDPGDGVFVDVPSPSGWTGAVLDNSRQHMITHYDPDPAPNGSIATARRHQWYVDWEVPADMPAATYRLAVRGPAWQGGARVDFTATSQPFAITQHEDATLEVEREGTMLSLRMRLPAVVQQSEQTWPIAGWRVHDPEAGPDAPITVRAPLRLRILEDGVALRGEHTVHFDVDAGAHAFDLADVDAGDGALVVEAHLDADVEPDPIAAAIP
jgi:hypothetical protein